MENLKYNYNVITIDLTGGLTEERFEYDGEAIYYHRGNSDISIKLNRKTEDSIPFGSKEKIEAPFKQFFITASASSETITLFLSKPKEIKTSGNKVDIDSVEKTGNASYGAVTIGTSEGVLVASNTSRKAVTIYNNGSVPIYIGNDVSVTTANGLPIPIEGSLTLDRYTGAIRAISGTAGQDVRFFEEG